MGALEEIKMSTATKRLPLIELPIGEKRELGILQVDRAGKKSALPLAAVDISARVADRVASVTVKQTFKNNLTDHVEAVYIFPLSGGCVVSDFEMKVGTRIIKGVVQERAQARMEYQQALEQGKRAALLEQERDDVFTVQVGNIVPDEEISVTLTYSERLPFFESGKTELRLPLVVAPRYIPGEAVQRDNFGAGTECDTDQVPDASRISPPRLVDGSDVRVAFNLSVEIATSDLSGTDTISDLGCSQHATQIGIGNDTVRIELARTDEKLNRDFVLQWRLATGTVRSSMLVYKKGESDSYAMLSITPPKRDGYVGAPRDVVFVLDRSGSMGGVKMTSAARACSILLSTLGPQDRFAIQAFDTVVEWLTLPGVMVWPSRWLHADESGLARGEKFLRTIDARGGTELKMAITEAFSAIKHRKVEGARIPILVVMTDGEVGNESEILRTVQKEIGEARLFVVGIDTAANSGLLRRLANLGGGTSALVAPGTDLERALASIGREIGAPMITDLELISEGSAIEADSVSPAHLPDLFEGRAVTAFFKVTGKGSIRVKGRWSDGSEFDEKVKSRTCAVPAVAQLWAKSVITDLEDQFRVQPNPAVRTRIIQLSIAHSFLTKFTAFVAVDDAEVVNKDGSLRQLVQPVEQPAMWEAQSLGAACPAPMMSMRSAQPGSLAKLSQIQPPAAPGAADGWGAPQLQREYMLPAENSPAQEGGGGGGGSFGGFSPYKMFDKLAGRKPAKADSSAAFAALQKFSEVLSRLAELISSGTMPSGADLSSLEDARKKLLEALGREAFGMEVPLLQKFLRGAAVELIESLKQSNGTLAGVQRMWERHMVAFHIAGAEATTKLGSSSTDGRFWEASV
jgi:Ca-activated chloride channel family protein